MSQKNAGSPGGWINPDDNKTAGSFTPYTVKVDVGSLNIRTGPGTNYSVAAGSPIKKACIQLWRNPPVQAQLNGGD